MHYNRSSLVSLCLNKKLITVRAMTEVRVYVSTAGDTVFPSLFPVTVVWRKISKVVLPLLFTVPLPHSPGRIINRQVRKYLYELLF